MLTQITTYILSRKAKDSKYFCWHVALANELQVDNGAAGLSINIDAGEIGVPQELNL